MPGIYSRTVESQTKAAEVARELVMSDESFQYSIGGDEYVFTVPEHAKSTLDRIIEGLRR